LAKFCVVVVVVAAAAADDDDASAAAAAAAASAAVVAAAGGGGGGDDEQGFDIFWKISWLGRYFDCNSRVDHHFMVSSCGCRPDRHTVFFFVLFSCCLSRTFGITGIRYCP